MLHIVNKSPFASNALDSCLKHLTDGAAIILIEDGVYAATEGISETVSAAIAKACDEGAKIYVLSPDMDARGFTESNIIKKIQVADYERFVDLVVEHDNVQTW